jgi:hypothetical protein
MKNNFETVEQDADSSRHNLKYQGAVGIASKEINVDVVEAVDGATLPFIEMKNNSETVEHDADSSRHNLKYKGAIGTVSKESNVDVVEAVDGETLAFHQMNNNPGDVKLVELHFRDTANKDFTIYVEHIDWEALPVLQESNIVDKIIKAYERSLRNKTEGRHNSF